MDLYLCCIPLVILLFCPVLTSSMFIHVQVLNSEISHLIRAPRMGDILILD